jgi:hypothetical protein
MNEAPLSPLAAVPLLAGLLWLLGPADEGAFAFVFSVVPGALLLAGGVATVALPGDLRAAQMTALGGGLGTVVGVLALVFAGFGTGLLLIALSAASFVAAGWMAQAQEPEYDDVPETPLTLGLAAKVAIDEAVLATMSVTARPPRHHARHLSAGEVREAESLFGERGWLEKPASFHVEPPALESPEIKPARIRSTQYEHVSFESGFEPHPDVPGSERWQGYTKNRTAHAWMVRHRDDEPRPWLVGIHGYGMGRPSIDLAAFTPGLLHRELGMNMILPILPLHGPRRIATLSGRGYLGGFELDTVHAWQQAMWDIRRILSWVRAQGATSVHVFGLSLGGYTTALLSSLDGSLDTAIPTIPAVDAVRMRRRFATPMMLRDAEAIGLSWDDVENVLRVVSPLALEPQVPHDRRFIIAATADRLVPPDHPRDLWLHWDKPRIVWYQGSHLSIGREPQVPALLREVLPSV